MQTMSVFHGRPVPAAAVQDPQGELSAPDRRPHQEGHGWAGSSPPLYAQVLYQSKSSQNSTPT